MKTKFESGVMKICGSSGISNIKAHAGHFVINGGSGISNITTGSGIYTIHIGSGVTTIQTGSGVNFIHGGSGSTTINTGCGYSDITTASGVCNITTGSHLGTTRVTFGSGLTVIDGKQYPGYKTSNISTYAQVGCPSMTNSLCITGNSVCINGQYIDTGNEPLTFSSISCINGQVYINGKLVSRSAKKEDTDSEGYYGKTDVIGNGSYEDYQRKVDLSTNICEVNGVLLIDGKKPSDDVNEGEWESFPDVETH